MVKVKCFVTKLVFDGIYLTLNREMRGGEYESIGIEKTKKKIISQFSAVHAV